MEKNKTFYISTPIYYPSGKPHIGHAYSTILADVIKRYKALIGYETFFVTGTDEHGKKIEESAKKSGLSTIEYLNQMVDVFKDLWVKLGIEYDHFSRTTNQNHIDCVQSIFSTYLKKDLIYLNTWQGLYCVSCEENIAKKDAILKDGKLTCVHGHVLVDVSEESYFFKMQQFNEWISKYFKDNDDFIFPKSRVNELTNNFLNSSLEDLSISRSSFSWGIPIKENDKHVIYVWMDALFNYVTALNYNETNDELYQKFWNNPKGEIVHILSKEITRFHCIYWPIFLHTLGLRLPTKIISHGWILADGNKMSKSLNNVIEPFQLIEKFGRDALRYYLIKDISLHNDSTFSEEALIGTFNGDLANNFGNLVSRTIGMMKKYCNGTSSSLSTTPHQLICDVLKKIPPLNNQNYELVDKFQIQKVIANIQGLIDNANLLIETIKPWELFKNNEMIMINDLMISLLKIIEISCFWLQPILIDGVKEALNQTNLQPQLKSIDDVCSVENIKVNDAKPIFARIVSNED